MRNVIKDTFGAIMKRNEFKRKSNTWYHRTDDTILVVNLQSEDGLHFVNLAIWLNVLGENTFPKEYQCHIRLRADMLDDPDQSFRRYLEPTVFNITSTNISDAERSQQIQSLMEDRAIPFLLLCGSLKGIRKVYREGRFRGAGVFVDLEKFFSDLP